MKDLRRLSLVLVLAMALAACGGGDTGDSGDGETTAGDGGTAADGDGDGGGGTSGDPIVVGGLGSVAGAVYGAAFMLLVPALLERLGDTLRGTAPIVAEKLPAIENAVFGLVIIIFLIVEPRGLARIWQRIKDYFRLWPFRY